MTVISRKAAMPTVVQLKHMKESDQVQLVEIPVTVDRQAAEMQVRTLMVALLPLVAGTLVMLALTQMPETAETRVTHITQAWVLVNQTPRLTATATVATAVTQTAIRMPITTVMATRMLTVTAPMVATPAR